MAINLEELEELPPPREIVELKPCTPWEEVITRFRIGRLTISPRYPGSPEEKTVPAVRLFVPEDAKEYFPYYYDFTPKRVVYQLVPMLRAGIPEDHMLRIHRDISGPRAHFSVSWEPVE